MERETITLDKQALLQALLAMAKEEAFQTWAFDACVERLANRMQEMMETTVEELRGFFDDSGDVLQSGRALLKLLFTKEERETFLSDERMEAWQEEFSRRHLITDNGPVPKPVKEQF